MIEGWLTDIEAWMEGGGVAILAFGGWLLMIAMMVARLLYQTFVHPLDPPEDHYGRRRDW